MVLLIGPIEEGDQFLRLAVRTGGTSASLIPTQKAQAFFLKSIAESLEKLASVVTEPVEYPDGREDPMVRAVLPHALP